MTTDKLNKNETQNLLARYRGAMLGLACGDAVGTTVEFLPRDRFRPLTDMVGHGKFKLKPGEWTDDTSMAICLTRSLIEKQGFDPTDQMDRYINWVNTGSPGPKAHPIGIGQTIMSSLCRYKETGNPFAGVTDSRSAGNGALMRLAPIVLAYYPNVSNIQKYSRLSTLTTHAADECITTSAFLAEAITLMLSGSNKKDIQSICAEWDDIHLLPENQIKGIGYAPESLKAAIWSFINTDTFENAILTAANLGDDADTTAAICGQIAGAYYGVNEIPSHWLDRLFMGDKIFTLADQLYEFKSTDASGL